MSFYSENFSDLVSRQIFVRTFSISIENCKNKIDNFDGLRRGKNKRGNTLNSEVKIASAIQLYRTCKLFKTIFCSILFNERKMFPVANRTLLYERQENFDGFPLHNDGMMYCEKKKKV